jgi:general secretion pathway protein E
LVASSLIALMAQRLVRKVCPECKKLRPPTEEELERLGLTLKAFTEGGGGDYGFNDPERPPPPPGMVYTSDGCSACMGTGYSGRTGIYELLMMNDEVRSLILKNADANTIKNAAVEGAGMRTLRIDGVHKILSGWTTIEEVMRVTQEDAS